MLYIAVLLSGCEPLTTNPNLSALPEGANTTGPELQVVRWGMYKIYQPVFIASRKGLFEQEGVHVEFVGAFTSGPSTIQAAATGDLDAGHSAISGIINAVNSGIEIIGIADSQTEFEDAPLMQWFVLDTSGISVPADLRQKKIGVNSLSGSFYYTVLIYLSNHGLSKDDVQFVVMPHNIQEQALRSHQIDVAGIIDPYSVHAQRDGGVRVLFRAVDVLGEIQFSHVFFRKEYITQHPDTVRRFVRAYTRAIDFMREKPEEASALMGDAIGVSAQLVGTHRYKSNASVDLNDVQFWIDMMRKQGELTDGGKLTPTDVATTTFTLQ